MADAFIRLRKYKDAIEALEKVVELSRPEDVIYEAIGHCYDKLRNYAQARFYYRKASHLNQEDAKLLYKIAGTYMNEENWQQAIKYLEQALQLARTQTDFNLAMGDCYMQLGKLKDAIHYYTVVVQYRPRNRAGWESLIRCLYTSGLFEEAGIQIKIAASKTGNKPLFLYYRAAIELALGRTKDGLLLLEEALHQAPKLLKKFIELNPVILQDQGVVDVIARAKRK